MLIKLLLLSVLFGMHAGAYAGNDPTRPPNIIAQQLAPLQQLHTGVKLSAIFTRSAQRYAVVNGEVLKLGDEIIGMKISSIDASHVTLKNLRAGEKDLILEVQNSAGMSKEVVK